MAFRFLLFALLLLPCSWVRAEDCPAAYAQSQLSFGRFLVEAEEVDRLIGSTAAFEKLKEGWVQKAGKVDGNFYRGISLSQKELENVLANGMEITKTQRWGPGPKVIYASVKLSTAFTYGMGGAGPRIRAIFEIDPAGLLYEKISRNHVVFPRDIPRNSMKRVFLFDPKADVKGFPFVVIQP